jgi:hypothetical protein
MGMFDVNLEIVNERRLRTKRYEKKDGFNFLVVLPVGAAYEGGKATIYKTSYIK